MQKCESGALLYSGKYSLLLIILYTLPRQFKYFGEEKSLSPLKGIKTVIPWLTRP